MDRKKVVYHLRNWSKYNQALVKRGDITFWFSQEAINKWLYQGKQKQGAPKQYSNLAIQTILTLRSLLSLPLRQIQGFTQALTCMMNINVPIPDYTTICRRQATLIVPPSKSYRKNNEAVNIVIDSTGLKVFGEGEWKVRRHGYTKHRMWRKLHLAVNPKTGVIIANDLTTNNITDADAALPLVNSIDVSVSSLIGDAAYDKVKIYELCRKRGIYPLIRPRSNARQRTSGKEHEPWFTRNIHLLAIQSHNIEQWKKHFGYSIRSFIEATMFRYKTTFGDRPLAHTLNSQKVEVNINCNILNDFLKFGKPSSFKVAV